MTDIFHKSVSWNWLYKIMLTIQYVPQHTCFLLTKRPKKAKEFFDEYHEFGSLSNLWLGVTVESQDYLERVSVLADIPVQNRWVSFEPLLGEVSLDNIPGVDSLDWAVIGGESGSGKDIRPCNIFWISSLLHQCRDNGIAPWVKQLGSNPIGLPDGHTMHRRGYSYSKIEDLPDWLRIREYHKNLKGNRS